MKNCWITLGAYGDICNTLPLVWNDFQNGNHPTMMVAQDFASILDGVGYCDRLIWPGNYSESARAVDYVANDLKTFDNVYLVQCYGTSIERVTESFAKEAWRLVGMLDLWGKPPLIFDRRNKIREANYFNALKGIDPAKPLILVSYSGKSSPFPFTPSLLKLIDPLAEKFNVLDVSHLQLDRFYDVIGLMERAVLLITTDSGLLHLANSVPELPVIALVTDQPDLWHGSPKRPNHFAYIRYGEFEKRKNEIADLVGTLSAGGRIECSNRLIHVWGDYNRTNRGSIHRHDVAKITWQKEYDGFPGVWVPCVVHEKSLARNANMVNEQKPVPFVKDLFNEAAKMARFGDILVFSNDDTCFSPSLTSVILENCRKHGAMWGARWECHSVPRPLSREEFRRGYRHCGSDVFAFTLEWWERYRDDFPDFLLSFEAWDLVLKKLILLTAGVEVQDTCYHEIHESFWHTEHNRNCTGNLYNRELTRQWLAAHNIRWEDAFK